MPTPNAHTFVKRAGFLTMKAALPYHMHNSCDVRQWLSGVSERVHRHVKLLQRYSKQHVHNGHIERHFMNTKSLQMKGLVSAWSTCVRGVSVCPGCRSVPYLHTVSNACQTVPVQSLFVLTVCSLHYYSIAAVCQCASLKFYCVCINCVPVCIVKVLLCLY